MVVMNEDGVIDGTQEARGIFGFQDDELRGQPLSTLFASPFKGICMSLALESVQRGEHIIAEGVREGNRFPVSIRVTEAPSGDSKIYIANISKLSSSTAFMTVTKSGVIVAANNNAEEIFKTDFHSLCGMPLATVIPTIDSIGVFMRDHKEGWETVGKASTGKQLSLNVTMENGVSGLINVTLENLELEIEGSMGLFLTLDENGIIVETSKYQHYSLIGYNGVDLLGKPITTVLPDLDVESYLECSRAKRIKRNSKEGSISTCRAAFTVQVKHKDGTLKPFTMNIWRHKASQGHQLSIQLRQGVDIGAPSFIEDLKSSQPVKNLPTYIIGQQIDAATAGNVYQAVHAKTGENVVVKVQDKRLLDPNMKERIELEFQVGQKLIHPNIISYLEQIDVGTHVVTVMEYGIDGNLEKYLEKKVKLDEAEARKFFAQLVTAVRHCHENNCVHGDIKLSNVVLRGTVLKLIDFSASKPTDDSGKRRTFCGTTQYVAPEVIMETNYPGKMADVWSLGVCLYYMVVGDYPFRDIATALQGKFKVPPEVSTECADLIQKILKVNTAERATIDQILEHPWVKNNEKSSMKIQLEEKKESEQEDKQTTTVAIQPTEKEQAGVDKVEVPISENNQEKESTTVTKTTLENGTVVNATLPPVPV